MPNVLSLDKSLTVLETIFQSREGAGTRTLARQLDLNVATVHNIAMTFCKRGYLRQDADTKQFLPGMRLMLLGRHPSYLRSLVASVGGIVDDLAQTLNESVLLGAIDMGRVLNLKYVPSRQALRVHEPEDVSDHSYCTAFGKVLLASLSEHELERYLRENKLTAFTPRTLSTAEGLKAELKKVRELGFAQTRDEYCEGVSAVAVPIRDPWGAIIASIGASAPTVRMQKPRQFEESLKALKEAGAAIELIWAAQMETDAKSKGARARKPRPGAAS